MLDRLDRNIDFSRKNSSTSQDPLLEKAIREMIVLAEQTEKEVVLLSDYKDRLKKPQQSISSQTNYWSGIKNQGLHLNISLTKLSLSLTETPLTSGVNCWPT